MAKLILDNNENLKDMVCTDNCGEEIIYLCDINYINHTNKNKTEMIIKSPNHTEEKKWIKTVKECEGCIHDGDCGNQIDKKDLVGKCTGRLLLKENI